jgi:hypothetical protein
MIAAATTPARGGTPRMAIVLDPDEERALSPQAREQLERILDSPS